MSFSEQTHPFPDISIQAVGDISFGDYNMSLGFGVRSVIEKKGPSFIFEKIKKKFEHADIVFGNLEGVLSDANLSNDINSMVMRGNPQSINGLVDAGFNVINIANNHIMQHGKEAFNETCELLEKNNITIVGLRGNQVDFCQPAIRIVKGMKIGFLGYGFEPDRYAEEILYAFGTRERVLSDIFRLKPMVDLVVVSCHWGIELLSTPSRNTICLAHEMIEQGADIILGHHPHVVQGVEEYRNGVIYYSLGNFVFDLPFPPCRQSCIAAIQVNGCGIKHSFIPVRISNDYQPLPLAKKEYIKLIDYFDELSGAIPDMICNDSEELLLQYYLKFNKLRRYERLVVLINLIKNIHKVNLNTLCKLVFEKTFSKWKMKCFFLL